MLKIRKITNQPTYKIVEKANNYKVEFYNVALTQQQVKSLRNDNKKQIEITKQMTPRGLNV